MGVINGSLSILCAIFSVMLFVALQLSPQWRRFPYAKTAFLIMASVFSMLLCDGVAMLLLTDRPILFNVLETVSVISSFLAEWFFGLFLISMVGVSPAAKRGALTVVGISCLTWGALFLVNLFHPFLYDFGELRYLSDAGYWCGQITNLALLLLAVSLLFFKGGKIAPRDRVFVAVTLLLPISSFLWDSLISGLSSRYVLVFLAMAVNYLRLIFVMAEASQEEINRLERNRIFSTMERIKPHYIYNVLASIYYLCDQDVSVAKQAIAIFSDYLRDVLNMMEEQTLISFERELRTVRNYLELERMRFGERICVRYQIRSKAFNLPPFSVQPLVENSVKHGLANAETEGEILISSFEDENNYYVVIQDTFEGFDSEQLEEEGGSGTGTKYIRDILKMTVNGSLLVESKPGKGTISVISIPKKN